MSSEAEKKFSATPELVEQLLSHLDLKSTSCLAEIHQMTREVLQGGRVWKKLIQRNCPIVELDQAKHFVAILKTLESPDDHILVLLDAICESNKSRKPEHFGKVFGRIWEAPGSSGRLWEALGGSGRLLEALGGSVRLWKAPGSSGRLWKALGSSKRLWEAPEGSQRLLEAGGEETDIRFNS